MFTHSSSMAPQPLVGQGLLIIEASQSHSGTPQSVGLVWASNQPDAETSTSATHNSHNRQTSMPPAGLAYTIPANERQQKHALHRTGAGIGLLNLQATSYRIAGKLTAKGNNYAKFLFNPLKTKRICFI
jgi:hypothetical protein